MSSETADRDQQQKIQRRAYEIWEGDGRPDGKHLDHWQQAEREADSEPPASSVPSDAPAPISRFRKKGSSG